MTNKNTENTEDSQGCSYWISYVSAGPTTVKAVGRFTNKAKNALSILSSNPTPEYLS